MSGAKPDLREVVGVWRLVDCVAARGAERWRPHGEAPIGRLVYSAGGRVIVVLGDRERLPFAKADPRGGAPEECVAAMSSFAAYTGDWRVEGDRLVHAIALAWAPPWTGQTLVRHAVFTGDTLRLSAPTTAVAGAGWDLHLDWAREE